MGDSSPEQSPKVAVHMTQDTSDFCISLLTGSRQHLDTCTYVQFPFTEPTLLVSCKSKQGTSHRNPF